MTNGSAIANHVSDSLNHSCIMYTKENHIVDYTKTERWRCRSKETTYFRKYIHSQKEQQINQEESKDGCRYVNVIITSHYNDRPVF